MDLNLVGKTLGEYEILGEAGRGGMGVVYRAREAALRRTVAIKVLPPHLAARPEEVARFRQEARAAAQLAHPNIVTVHSLGIEGDLHFIVMEFVRGRDLGEIIREKGPMDLREALGIARQLAGALAAAHAVGVIHRDIKPQNIMLDEAGRPRIMDFGIARMAAEAATTRTREGFIVGTPGYMSPEQCRGTGIGAGTDIYSLGVVLFEMLAGYPPFRAESPVAVIHQILYDRPPSLTDLRSDLPAAVARLIDRCLEKDSADRPGSAADLEEVLTRLASEVDASTSAQRELRTQELELLPAQAVKQPRRILALGAFVGLGLLGILSAAVFAGRGGAKEASEPIPSAPTEQAQVVAEATPAPSTPALSDSAPMESAAEPELIASVIPITPSPDPPKPNAGEKIAAAANDATIEEALKFYTGVGGRVDEARARALMLKAADGRNPVAIAWIAWFRHWGRCGFELDPGLAAKIAPKTVQEIRRLAEGGRPDAAFLYGSMLDLGLGVERNSSKAAPWITKAADAGRTYAMNYLGWMHVEGRGVAKDEKRALACFRRSADAKDVGGMHNLGGMLAEGRGGAADPAKAVEIFRRGADAGDARTMNDLAWMYEEGRGVARDENAALFWFKKAADSGDARSMRVLGMKFAAGGILPKDASQSVAWYQRAARLGDASAQAELKRSGQSW